eukprot:6149072-Prymnesium_polylepis.1
MASPTNLRMAARDIYPQSRVCCATCVCVLRVHGTRTRTGHASGTRNRHGVCVVRGAQLRARRARPHAGHRIAPCACGACTPH